MSINGIQNITVGSENQATGSESIFSAFNKTQNNFTRLFSCASPYNNFVGSTGLIVGSHTGNNTVTFTNTGVLSITAGTGVTLSGTTGDITISAAGGGGGAGVTNVGISSSTLRITNTPVISSGIINVELPAITNFGFAAGEYIAPTLTVDEYGRINSIASTTSVGTVTSVAVAAEGSGIAVSGGPITSSGTITITNTGVTRINAGQGISVSGTTGNITIASAVVTRGTVTRVDVTSTTLTVLNSPITQSGTISIDIPNDVSLPGNLISSSIRSNTTANITGNVNAGNLKTTGLLSVTGNANIGNIGTGGLIIATGNITGANIIGNAVIAPAHSVTGPVTKSAWGTTGVGLTVISDTYTDNSSVASATVANAHIHAIARPTIAASNATVTYTKAATLYISGAPINGANATVTNPYSVQIAGGNVQIDTTSTAISTTTGALRVAGGVGVVGNVYIGNSVFVSGNANITTDINVTGNISGGNITTAGNINLGALVKLTPQATAPGTPSEGMIYYNSVSHELKVYNGTVWKSISMA